MRSGVLRAVNMTTAVFYIVTIQSEYVEATGSSQTSVHLYHMTWRYIHKAHTEVCICRNKAYTEVGICRDKAHTEVCIRFDKAHKEVCICRRESHTEACLCITHIHLFSL